MRVLVQAVLVTQVTTKVGVSGHLAPRRTESPQRQGIAMANTDRKPGVLALIKQSASDFMKDDCMSAAAALSYYTIFSFPPFSSSF